MKLKARPMSRRITSFVAVCVLIILLVAEFSNGIMFQKNIMNNNREILSVEAGDNVNLIRSWMQKQGSILSGLMISLAYMDSLDEEMIMNYLEEQLPMNEEALMYYVCFAYNKSVLPADHSQIDLDPTERDWWKQSMAKQGMIITDPYCDSTSGKMVITVAAPVVIHGEQAVILADITIDKLIEMINQVGADESTQVFVTTSDGSIITHTNPEFLPKESGITKINDIIKIDINDNSVKTLTDYDGVTKYVITQTISETGWVIGITKSMELVKNQLMDSFKIIVIILLAIIIISGIVLSKTINRMLKPVSNMVDVIVRISEGDFSIESMQSKRRDEIGVLQNSVSSLLNTLRNIIGDTNRVLGSMAEYNLVVDDMAQYPGDFEKLSDSVNRIKHILNDLLSHIQQSASNVENSAAQFTMASENLAEGTISQASSIEKLENDVKNISESIQANSESCSLVNERLGNLDAQIKEGNEQMEELLETVKEVESMSNDIQKIVEAIDSIAFQTNILALNASVEAARVGQEGRGFAVVAEEVRNLAYKCGEESQKTATLIEGCIAAINKAKDYADSTSECMQNVVNNSAEISEAFNIILQDTEEQAKNSAGIESEIINISDVVQTNTATTEETAASSKLLADEALKLNRMMKKFKI